MDEHHYDEHDATDFWKDFSGNPSPHHSPVAKPSIVYSVPPALLITSCPSDSSTSTPTISSHDPDSPASHSTNSHEDSYWESYASVQGTADSTIPSPRAAPKSHGVDDFGRPLLHPDEGTSPLDATATSTEEITPSWEMQHLITPIPAHQRALEMALHRISPRPSPPEDLIDAPAPDSSIGVSSTSPSMDAETSSLEIDLRGEDETLKDAIRGVYNLWRGGSQDDVELRGRFLRQVKDALIGI